MFLTDNLWPTIQRLDRRSKRREVVVAYLGTDAGKLLKLGKDDRLVVDMSMAAVKSGQTNPIEVEKYLRCGVEVFNCSNLHAKVYVFDRAAIIASANVSRHSCKSLVEAGLLCRDRDVVAQVRGFVKSLQVDPVSPEYVKRCKRFYRPPKMQHSGKRTRTGKITPQHSRLWLVGVYPDERPKEEERLCQTREKLASKKLKDTWKFQVESVRWTTLGSRLTKEVGEGDLFISIWCNGKEMSVYPPARVLRITHYKSFDRKKLPRMFIHIEEPKRPRVLRWRKFKNALVKVGLGRVGRHSEREVRSAEAVHAILGLWS